MGEPSLRYHAHNICGVAEVRSGNCVPSYVRFLLQTSLVKSISKLLLAPNLNVKQFLSQQGPTESFDTKVPANPLTRNNDTADPAKAPRRTQAGQQQQTREAQHRREQAPTPNNPTRVRTPGAPMADNGHNQAPKIEKYGVLRAA